MQIHTGFVDKILLVRKSSLGDVLHYRNCLNIEKLKPDLSKLINELDKIFYTIEFLEKEGLIYTHKFINNNSQSGEIFNGFDFASIDDVGPLIFYQDKLKEDFQLEVQVKPGLLVFKNNGYKTNEQLKERKNFWLPILVALLSASVTSIMTTFLTSYISMCN